MTARRLGAAALALGLIATVGLAIAQEGGEAPSDAEQRRQRLEAFDPGAATDQAGPDFAFPDPPDPAASAETTQAYQATLQA
jgi:hypothetical protein